MREENKNVSKNGWRRVLGKKWFFPAVYLTVAALLLTGVLWYQNLDNQIPEASEEPNAEIDNNTIEGNELDEFGEDAAPVMESQEVVKMPLDEESQAEIVTKFYDYNADSEDQEKALVQYNNIYYQSDGVDITSADGETFDVTASLSGTVSDVKEDPLLGNVVKITHDNDLTTHYAALGEVLVETGAEVKQGDVIGTAGNNVLGQAKGVHVHFQLRKTGEPVNPESYFNVPVSQVEAPKAEEDDSSDSSDSEENTESDEEQKESEENTESDEEQKETDGEDDAAEESTSESSAAMANA